MMFSTLWPERDESPRKARKIKKLKRAKNRFEEEAPLVGFSVELGTIQGIDESGKPVRRPVTLTKDPFCWILRIGGRQTYPSTLTGVFQALAHEHVSLYRVKDVGELVKEFRRAEDQIREYAKILDERIRTHLRR